MDILALIVGTVFAAVFLLVVAVTRIVRARYQVSQRLMSDLPGGATVNYPGLDGTDPSVDRRSLRHPDVNKSARGLLEAASKFVPTDKEALGAKRRDLIQAGFFDAGAVQWYYAARLLLAAALPVSCLIVAPLIGMPAALAFFCAAALGIIGLLIPKIYIERRAKRLQRESINGFPDFMDIMMICLEAGLSVPAALDRVSRELSQTYPHLATNLHLATLELRAGQTLVDTMDHLSDRLGIDDVASLAVLLRQSEELGSSLADALRVYSSESRDKRMSRAEEKAHALPVKLTIPLGLFIFPVMMIFIMLPLIIRIREAFF